MKLNELKKLKMKKSASTPKTSSLRDKFKKRDQTVLDKTYEDRNERSKGGMSKSVFNQDMLEKFGITEFSPTSGDHFIEILPISLNPTIPYFKEISVHFSVGFTNDMFICMQRHQKGNKKRCYRCEAQAKMWKKQENYKKDDIVKLYPNDRICYLLWERTKELVDNETPNFSLKLWASPKTKVHSEIQEKVRNKITQTTLDISDLSDDEDSDGRTVSFTIVKKGDFPDYRAFDIFEREEPIPNEILEKLDELITHAEELGNEDCIEMFFDYPEYDDIKEAMQTEIDDIGDVSDDDNAPKKSLKSILKGKTNNIVDMEKQKDGELEEFLEELDDLKGDLQMLSQKPLLWKKWLKDNDYEEALEMDTLEAVEAIVDDMFEKFNLNLNKKYGIEEDDIPY